MAATSKSGETTFVYQCPEAKQVYLVGDFNEWDPKASRMVKAKGGLFKAKVNLAPGEHEYKYIVDGEWQLDPEAEAQRTNSYGTCNSVVRAQ